MNAPGLTSSELALIVSVFQRHPEISEVKLFGSRAKLTQSAASDVDLAVWGAVDPLLAEEIASDLDELPLPYQFEIQPFASITNEALREHVERVGISIYSEAVVAAK